MKDRVIRFFKFDVDFGTNGGLIRPEADAVFLSGISYRFYGELNTMHMADALLSPAVGATLWGGTLGAIVYCSKKLKENMDEKMIPLMGVLGAFIFSAQMINFAIPGTGSSGHLGGGMMLAIILGPYAAFIVMASVLTVQAFFFADGGLLALGCNIWNLGIYPCFVAYLLVYKPLVKSGSTPKRIAIAALVSSTVALQLGAFSVVIETLLSGRSDLPFSTFALVMQPIHLGIGIVEGVVTAGVINFIRDARPELLENDKSTRMLSVGVSMRKVLTGLLLVTVLTGGVLSWFASSNPDGLEWSVERVFGSPELPEHENGKVSMFNKIREKTAFLPGYHFRTEESRAGGLELHGGQTKWPSAEADISISGILGSAIVLCLILLIGFFIRIVRKNKPLRKTPADDI